MKSPTATPQPTTSTGGGASQPSANCTEGALSTAVETAEGVNVTHVYGFECMDGYAGIGVDVANQQVRGFVFEAKNGRWVAVGDCTADDVPTDLSREFCY